MDLQSLSLKQSQKRNIYLGFVFLASIFFLGGMFMDNFLLAALPLGLIYAYYCFKQPYYIFILFFAAIPFSTEIELAGGFATDLPSEPIMITITGLFFLLFIKHAKRIKTDFFRNSVSLILFLHLACILFTAVGSTHPIISLKFLIAKCWYVIPFYFFPLLMWEKTEDIQRIFKIVLISMFVACTYVMLRHAGRGFSFDTINNAVRPIFRNHVNYAAMVALCIPYFWALWRNSFSRNKWIFIPTISFFLAASYFSYTRAAFVSIIIAAGAYYIIRMKLLGPAVFLSLAIGAGIIVFMIHDNNYLRFAPNYERTVAHENFDNLVEATYKMEDISTMERLHRWIAGFHMVSERPLMGYGPGCFYSEYQNYTLNKFETYVSDNPERSGIHNYYLMIFVEQGIIGFLVFLMLTIFPFFIGAKTYFETEDIMLKRIVMSAILSLLIIDAVLLINDLIEADKVGPFYFLNLCIIAWASVRLKRRKDKGLLSDNKPLSV